MIYCCEHVCMLMTCSDALNEHVTVAETKTIFLMNTLQPVIT